MGSRDNRPRQRAGSHWARQRRRNGPVGRRQAGPPWLVDGMVGRRIVSVQGDDLVTVDHLVPIDNGHGGYLAHNHRTRWRGRRRGVVMRVQQQIPADNDRNGPQPVGIEAAGMVRGSGRRSIAVIVGVVSIVRIRDDRTVGVGGVKPLVVRVGGRELTGGLTDIVAVKPAVVILGQTVEPVTAGIVVKRIGCVGGRVAVDRVHMALSIPARFVQMAVAVRQIHAVMQAGQMQDAMPVSDDRRRGRRFGQAECRAENPSLARRRGQRAARRQPAGQAQAAGRHFGRDGCTLRPKAKGSARTGWVGSTGQSGFAAWVSPSRTLVIRASQAGKMFPGCVKRLSCQTAPSALRGAFQMG